MDRVKWIVSKEERNTDDTKRIPSSSVGALALKGWNIMRFYDLELSNINQYSWSKYGVFRAVTGSFRTLRLYVAAKEMERNWDDSRIRPLPKMRAIPEAIQETNYGEWKYSFIREDRWARTRQKYVDTRQKNNRLRKRQQQKHFRAQQKR